MHSLNIIGEFKSFNLGFKWWVCCAFTANDKYLGNDFCSYLLVLDAGAIT